MDTMTIITASTIVIATIFTFYISVTGRNEKSETVSTTKKESQADIDKGQLITTMEILIKGINAKSDYNLAIISDITEQPWFEISIQCEFYTEGPPNFQRRISMREAETVAWNIFYIIKDYHGYEYKPKFEWVKPRDEGQQFSDGRRDYIEYSADTLDIPLHKKVHVRMLFAE